MDEDFIKDAMTAYGSMVLRIAKAVTGSNEDAEDVFSDTFFAVWQCNKPFNSSDHLKAWLIKVAVNKAKNIKYQAYNRYKAQLTDDIAATCDYLDDNCAKERVTDALMKLKPDDRVVIHLYHYEGYSDIEIAQMLSLRASSVRSRVSRAVNKLKGFLVKPLSKNEANEE